MSRNFELLQKAEKADQIFSIPPVIAGSGNTSQPQFRIKPPEPREEINKLVHRIFALPDAPGPRVVVFTSVGNVDSSAGLCAGAAKALAARTNGTVCVVEANFHSPSLHGYFDLQDLEGLGDGISRSGSIRMLASRVAASNLWVLPCESAEVNPATLVNAGRLPLRMKELREGFDYVLVNSSAADRYSDATVLGQLADGVILVVEANSTLREVIQKIKQDFDTAGVRLLGAVLNNRTFPIPQVIYDRLK
jgi:Mrp family chromosome partitioning ATPase